MAKLLCFGEIMLRLSPPGRELLLQTPKLEVWTAGAEANVATALALLGHEVRVASAVPPDDLGRAAVATLRGHGVDVSGIAFSDGRMGLYFVTPGAGARATEVIYDRTHSAFAEFPPERWDWPALFEGVEQLHLSGITPALGPGPAESSLRAVREATTRGVAVSFDGNWRGKLWERRGGDPRPVLAELVAHADILFGDHRDITLLLGREFPDDEDRPRAAAEAAFKVFPKLRMIASTTRRAEHADRHRLSARIDARQTHAGTDEVELAGIVDRIGSGDAFVAGVLDALHSGRELADAAHQGLALAVLKHSLPGDASLFRRADLDAYRASGPDIRR